MQRTWRGYSSWVLCLAVALATVEARAALVFAPRDVLNGTTLAAADLEPLRDAWSALGGSGASNSLLQVDTRDGQGSERKNNERDRGRQVDFSIDNSPPGMATTGSSASQVPGAGAGGAVISYAYTLPLDDSPSASLAADSKTTLPSAPTSRWFRPPRM